MSATDFRRAKHCRDTAHAPRRPPLPVAVSCPDLSGRKLYRHDWLPSQPSPFCCALSNDAVVCLADFHKFLYIGTHSARNLQYSGSIKNSSTLNALLQLIHCGLYTHEILLLAVEFTKYKSLVRPLMVTSLQFTGAKNVTNRLES